MRRIELPPEQLRDLAERYRAGESVKALAGLFRVSRTALRRLLEHAGVEVRDRSGAMAERMRRASPSDRAAITAAAHAARRGSRDPYERKCRRAVTVQVRRLHVSKGEEDFAWLLSCEGISGIVHQQAVGQYNIDLGLHPVAVEIFGGGWHAYGRHKERSAARFREILNAGWCVVVVWNDAANHPIGAAAAKYVADVHAAVIANPDLVGEYHVIRGDGVLVAKGRDDLAALVRLPSAQKNAGSVSDDVAREGA